MEMKVARDRVFIDYECLFGNQGGVVYLFGRIGYLILMRFIWWVVGDEDNVKLLVFCFLELGVEVVQSITQNDIF